MSEITNNFNQQAREAEKAVLGGLMLETERFDSVILKISNKDFHGKDHQLIFESMGELLMRISHLIHLQFLKSSIVRIFSIKSEVKIILYL